MMFAKHGFRCALVVGVASVATAQEVIQTAPPGAIAPVGGDVRRVSSIIGAPVALQGADNYGRVDDVVLNSQGGIGYLAVSANGQRALLPYSAANINYGQRTVRYDVTPQAIQPFMFQGNSWPAMYDSAYISRVQNVFPNTTGLVPGTVGPAGTTVKEKTKVTPGGGIKVKDKVVP
jgi:sporulation protein YlmC with PRC-barrel domain